MMLSKPSAYLPTREIKTWTIRLMCVALVLVFLLGIISPGAAEAALSPEQRRALSSGARYVDVGDDSSCSIGGGPLETSAALSAQPLDPQWVDIIVRSANDAGVDPLIMATLMWVEQRGWPEYKTSGWHVSASSGTGPWQIIQDVWPSSAGDYITGAQDPQIATPVAAELIRGMGGDVSPLPMGSIRDNFGQGQSPMSVAALAKNYNAGGGTYRIPGVAGHKESGRIWRYSSMWSATKMNIIDNYIVIAQHVYYHIATGQQIPPLGDNNEHAAAALAMIDTIESFNPGASGTTVAPAPPADGDGGQTPTPSAAASGATVIALDPGHGGEVAEYADPVTGLRDRETTNSPEREDAQDVANRVKTSLESSGYSVVLVRTTPTEVVSKRERVERATAAGAQMAVSIHTTPGEINEVWPQRMGMYRQAPDGSNRVTFENQDTATKSEGYANAMAETRSAAEGHTVTTDPSQTTQSGSFGPSRGLPAVGNISLIQLWASDIPWVYNEIGQDSGTAISEARKQAYADGIINGIKQALPASGVGGGGGCGGAPLGTGDVVSTALTYAWPDHRGRGSVEKKPEYETAVQAARAESRYTGGIQYPGVDCGGFVTLVMVDSGFEPGYNCDGKQCAVTDGSGTSGQLQWVRDNWQPLGRGDTLTTNNLQPGDVAFRVTSSGANDGHTFMWVGDQPGFELPVASASMDSRAPMAGRENPIAANVEWYRKR